MPDTPLQLRIESQKNPIADEVSALIALVRPILEALLYGLKTEVVTQLGGHQNVTLFMLARIYRPGDGDCGICFEYAVHDAIKRNDPSVIEKIRDSMQHKKCKVPGTQLASILFGAEKTGAIKLIETAHNLLSDESRLLTGAQAQPIKLRRYIAKLGDALRKQSSRDSLPMSISGLWKADLFLGNQDTDRWVGTTVKINPSELEPAKGLRIGIVPSYQGRNDSISYDDKRNIVVCPLPYDGAFMELFYCAWVLVKQFVAADARVPRSAELPTPSHRMVAKLLEERRDYPVLAVIDALRNLAQPELLLPKQQNTETVVEKAGATVVATIITPVSRNTAS